MRGEQACLVETRVHFQVIEENKIPKRIFYILISFKPFGGLLTNTGALVVYKVKDRCIKSDEFSENFQRGGGGSFSIQKFILQILGTLNRAF